MAPQGGLPASAGDFLTDPQVDNNTTARTMLDAALGRWFKELSGGSGNGILYKRWQWHAISGDRWKDQAAFNEHDSSPERQRLDQIKALEWGPIHDAAIRLGKVNEFTTGEVVTEINEASRAISAAWPDKNGQAAADKVNALATTSKQFADTTKQLGTHLMGFVDQTKKVVQGVVDFANSKDGYFGYLGNGDDVDIAHFSEAIDEIDERLRIGVTLDGDPYDLGVARSNAPGKKIYHNFSVWWSDVEKGRLDRFCDEYRNNVGALRRVINEAHEAIETHLKNLMSASSSLNFQPFANLEALGNAGTQEPPPEKKPEDEKKKTTDDGDGSTGTGSTGDGSTGTGSTGTGSTGTQSYSPPPLSSEDPGGGTVDSGIETGTGTGTGPGTGSPGTGTTPGSADGGEVDPGIGQPEPGGPGRPNETVTIEDGDRKISVGSPDSEGNVSVTVDDGTGQPKTYQLDFGAGTGTDQAATGDAQTGAAGRPGPAGSFGPTGEATGTETPSQLTQDGAQHVHAGADGKVVLQDGNVTITAEHPPGQPDQVKLTVDDGTGKPTSYVIDYGDPTSPKVEPVEPAQTTPAPVQGFTPPVEQAQGFTAEPVERQFTPPVEREFTPPVEREFTPPVEREFTAQPVETAAASAASGGPVSNGAHALPDEPLPSVAGSDQPMQTTNVQAMGFDFAGGTDSGFADNTWSTQGDLLDDSQDQQVAPAAGEAGLASVPDSGGGQHAAQSGAPMGGGMMGGMGGMGAGGGQGGDSERSGGQWSIQGDLFSDEPAAARIAGMLDDEPGFDR